MPSALPTHDASAPPDEPIPTPHDGRRLARRKLVSLACGTVATWAGAGWGMAGEAPVRRARPPLRPPLRVTEPRPHGAEALADWVAFKRRFTAGDGRVIDTGQAMVSHSEGQAWTMLFAAAFDDPATFDSVWDWTRRSLRRPHDSLHAWRYVPQAPVPVADLNNATDADLFMAAALWRGAWRWGRADLAESASAIAQDILSLLVREVGPLTVLLPGAAGFEHGASLAINPSYYAFPALEELDSLVPSPAWARLGAHGRALLESGRFGRWGLPPDWLRLDRSTLALAPHPNWPQRFSYDAIRVPLWLAWSGCQSSVAALSFCNYWNRYQSLPPAWIDLRTDATATYAAPPGMVAIGRLATASSQTGAKASIPISFPKVAASPDYYSAALILLSRCAWQDRGTV